MFVLVDTSHHPARGYMQVVDRRDANTHIPLIRAHTLPGTIIHSDQWEAYAKTVATIPHIAQHSTVNHTLKFVNPTTGGHTACGELWRESERKVLVYMKEVHEKMLW